MADMKIKYKNVDELIPYENNPRINEQSVEFVARSIQEFGFKNPIIIDSNNVIIAGHTRLKACEQLGITRVPTITADDLTEEQIRAFRIADNKVAEKSGWDLNKLRIEIESIDLDMTDFGFGDFEISMLTDDVEPDGYDDDLIEKYTQNSDEFLKAKRVIITYKDEQEEEFLKELLGEEELKVGYSVEELMRL